jgi:hypothetical protein
LLLSRVLLCYVIISLITEKYISAYIILFIIMPI